MALTKEDLQAIGALLEPIKADLSDVKQRMTALEESHQAIRADIAGLNHSTGPQLKLILEGVQGMHDHYKRLDLVEARQEDHSHRIFALEQAVKAK